MLARRIIPCLDVKDGRVVKGVSFVNLRDAGDPVEVAKAYDEQGADELTFLDITASHEKRGIILDVVKRTSEQVFMPLTVGGGIKTLDDVKQIPLTDKNDLRKSQEMDPFPYGGLLGRDLAEVTTFRQTSGTTGKPVYVPETYESWQWRVEAWCHILYMAGFTPSHRIFLPFGYNVYVAFWEAHFAAEKLGCEVIPGGALRRKAPKRAKGKKPRSIRLPGPKDEVSSHPAAIYRSPNQGPRLLAALRLVGRE